MELNEQTFEREVLKSSMPVVVDYWAPWCSPCRLIAPVFEKLSQEVSSVKFAKLNVDENNELAHNQGILSIPCIVIYNKGEEINRLVGFQTEAQLKVKLQQALESV